MVTYGITQIKASAGSGKTYRLTELFLHRLASLSTQNTSKERLHYGLRDIIAMTFTNKAVAEMKHSILNKLKATAFGNETTALSPSQASIWIDTILEHYTSLRIQSIDSTLVQLLSGVSLSLGLPSNCKPLLSIDEELTFNILYTQYIQQSLHDNDSMQTIRKACRILVNETDTSFSLDTTLKKSTLELVKMITKHGMFAEKTQEEIDEILSVYQQIISSLQATYGKQVQEKKCTTLIARIKDCITEHALSDIHKHFIRAVEIGNLSSTMFKKDSFYDVLTKKGKDSIDEQVLAQLNRLYAQVASEIEIYNIITPCIQRASQAQPLIRIACHIVAMLNEYQKKEGVIMFSSVPVRLSHHFSSHHGIYEAINHIGTSINTIFFDEFQDTSTIQWYSLFPIIENVLANNGSFIYVGDVKQAIYSWRGGDSSLFESIYVEMQYEKKKDTLEYNWRSAEPIVSLANIFSEMEEERYAYEFLHSLCSDRIKQTLQVFPHIAQEAVEKLVEAYTKGKQLISSKTKDIQGRIRITELLTIDKEKDSIDESQEKPSDIKAKRIKEEFKNSLFERLLHVQQNDIAILTRTNQEAERISQWLLEWNLSYTIEGGIELYTVPLIQHIMLMLRFIHTQSDSSLYAVLYSLLCRDYLFSEEECLQWRVQTKGKQILSAFKESYSTLWNTYFEPFISQYTTYTPYQYIQECIRCFSLYERFPHCRLYLDYLLEVAFHANTHEVTNIARFLEHFETYKTTYKVQPSENTNAIQILSIHKSKGLEFPIVFLPFTTASRHIGSSPLSIYTLKDILQQTKQSEEELESLFGDIDIPLFTNVNSQHLLYCKEYIAKAIEEINLLYVALTRAKHELYIIINEKDPEFSFSHLIHYIINNETFISKHNIKQIKETTENPEKIVYEYSTIQEIAYNKEEISKENERPHIPLTVQAPHEYTLLELPPFDIEVTDQKQSEEVHTPFGFLSHFPTISPLNKKTTNIHIERGLLFHTALEYISMGFSIEQAIQKTCKDKEIREYYHEELTKKLQWFITQEFSSICLQQGLIEQRMLTKTGKELRADKIIEGKEEWIVIEYKTGNVYEEHITQITEYMEVLHDIRQYPTRAYLIYFDAQEEIPLSSDTIKIYAYSEDIAQ